MLWWTVQNLVITAMLACLAWVVCRRLPELHEAMASGELQRPAILPLPDRRDPSWRD